MPFTMYREEQPMEQGGLRVTIGLYTGKGVVGGSKNLLKIYN